MIMKLSVFVLSFFLILPQTYAKNVELKILAKWKRGNSTKTTESKVIAKLGKEWTIPFEGLDSLKMKMTVDSFKGKIGELNADPEKSISFNGKIFEVVNDQEKLIASPKVITLLGKEATLTKEDDNGDFLELRILPVQFSQN